VVLGSAFQQFAKPILASLYGICTHHLRGWDFQKCAESSVFPELLLYERQFEGRPFIKKKLKWLTKLLLGLLAKIKGSICSYHFNI